ncbi:MAG TPA: hypothetical protein VFJ43_05110, partial [Bacteroidia bacterium]|nr:hypothetical protein [Bacteroidia bacterium]
MKLKAVLFFLSTLCSLSVMAQEKHHRGKNGNFDPGSTTQNPPQKRLRPDTITPCFSFSLSYAYQIPGGDLRWRFGPNSNVGASAFYKSRQNVFFGFQ